MFSLKRIRKSSVVGVLRTGVMALTECLFNSPLATKSLAWV